MAESKLRKRYYSGAQIVDALCVSCCDYQTQMKVLNNLASADQDDVVEVVRCKDCKRLNKEEMRCFEVEGLGYRNVSDDDFCSRGERKDEVEE